MRSQTILTLSTLALHAFAESTTGVILDAGQQGLEIGQQALAAVELVIGAFAKEEANGTEVMVAVNLEDEATRDYEGSVGIIWAFDGYNNVLGSSDIKPLRIEAGFKEPITVHQYLGEMKDAQYLDFIASDDEICISLLAQTYGDDGKPFAWLGDVGKACGQAWEYGNKQINGGGSEVYKPACTWLDKDHGDDIDKKSDHTDSITTRQFKINLHSYSQAVDGTTLKNGTKLDIDYVCGSTIFTYEIDDPIPGLTPRGPILDSVTRKEVPDQKRINKRETAALKPVQQRKERPQSKKMAERLWVNSNPTQSAIELCNSATSRGSDFVSTDEGLFCDMDTKTLHPLCSVSQKSGCFDLDANALQLRRRDSAKLPRRGPSVKQYKKITYAD